MTHFVCTNCGFWQSHFEKPADCPVCLDFRHTPPEEGWRFLPSEKAAEISKTAWWTDKSDVVTLFAKPQFGIGPRGYLLQHPSGNVLFDNAIWYDENALQFLRSRGGLRWLSASHPHAYGALWRLQERFVAARVAVAVADLPWTCAFSVTDPVDEKLEIAPGLSLYRSGGHFDGHSVLHWAQRGILFAGDMLKLHFDREYKLNALSTHKAYNRRVPMSHAEIRRYRELVARLDFELVFTTFDSAYCAPDQVLALFDSLLAREPSMEPVPLEKL